MYFRYLIKKLLFLFVSPIPKIKLNGNAMDIVTTALMLCFGTYISGVWSRYFQRTLTFVSLIRGRYKINNKTGENNVIILLIITHCRVQKLLSG